MQNLLYDMITCANILLALGIFIINLRFCWVCKKFLSVHMIKGLVGLAFAAAYFMLLFDVLPDGSYAIFRPLTAVLLASALSLDIQYSSVRKR